MYPHVGLDDECDWNRVQPRYFIRFCSSSVADMPRANIITGLPHSTSENIKSNTNQDLHNMPELSIVHPSSQLCSHCQSSQWLVIPSPCLQYFSRSPPHGDFVSLQESADRGCTVCRFFWSYIVNSSSFTKETAGLFAEASLDNCAQALPDSMSEFRYESHSVMFDRIEDDIFDRNNCLKARQIKAFEPGSMIDDLESLIEEQIQPWMQGCCEQQGSHGRCGPANDSVALPTRLVYVGTSQHPLIELVETNQRETGHRTCPYLILSYCWGLGNSSAKTTSHNLMKRLQEIPMDELPKTIQDAILVTRMMGFQYIWIDAMCIIQATDENDRGDFTSEAPKMGDYYANADCCISASLASDSSEGFLTRRPLARFPIIQDMIVKYSTSPSTPSYSMFLWARQRPDELMKRLMDTPLMQRGWYLQELMLSRRILHWTFHGLYLQCQSSMFLEGSLEAWPYSVSDDFLMPGFFDADVFDPREILAVPHDKILAFDGWYRLLQIFSKRKLTFETDRLYAIHGIACVLVQRFGAEYFYGLFRRHLAQGLAWFRGDCPNSYARTNLKRPVKSSRRTGFPTWCWASDCPVEFDPIDEKHVFVHDNHPRRPRLFPTHPGNMTLRAGLDSRLYIKAPLIHVRLDKTTACISHNRNDRRIQGYYSCTLDTQLEGAGGSLSPRSPLYDSPYTALDQGVDVQWLLLGLDSLVGENYIGLLVYEMEGQEMRVYRRYARLMIEWTTQTSIQDFYDEPEEIILE